MRALNSIIRTASGTGSYCQYIVCHLCMYKACTYILSTMNSGPVPARTAKRVFAIFNNVVNIFSMFGVID